MRIEVVLKNLNVFRKIVEGIQMEGVGKINVEQEVKKSFQEIKEEEKEAKKQNRRANEREMEMRMREALEQEKRRMNVVKKS